MKSCETNGTCDPNCAFVNDVLKARGRLAAGVVMELCDGIGGCEDGACPMQEGESEIAPARVEEGNK